MEQPSKIPVDVEEKIQSLAGDIYIQIEDKVTAFVSTYAKPIEITDEIIENHLIYQSLQADFNKLKSDFETANSSHVTDTKAYQQTLSELKAQIASRDDVIKSNEQLNIAKLTDTEQVLKEKLVEVSELTASCKQLTTENKIQLESLNNVTKQLDESTQKITTLELSEHTFAKNDKAKSATLDVQNHQISDLTLQLNNLSSELDYLKAEHSQQSQSSSKQLSQEQSAIKRYQNEIQELKQKVIHVERSLSTEISKKELLEDNVKGLTQSITDTDKTLSNEKTVTERLNKEVETLNQKNIDAEALLESNKRSITQLEESIAELSEESSSTSAQLIEKQQKVDSSEIELTDIRNELKLVSEQLKLNEENKKETEGLLSAEKQTYEQQERKYLLEIDSLKQSIDKHRSELEVQASSNETQINNLNQTLSQETNTVKEYVEQLNIQKMVVEKQTETYNTLLDKLEKTDAESSKQITGLRNKIISLENNIIELTEKNTDLTNNYEESNKMIDGYQQEIIHLKNNYESANSNAQEIKKRVEVNKEKQESEYTKARDTIKYLRDENLDLHTKLDQQVTELEDKLREYRLRFEYAQKQLNSK